MSERKKPSPDPEWVQTAITKTQQGNPDAFRGIFEYYYPQLRDFAATSLDHTLAEDIAQQALISAWKYLGSYNPAYSFRNWLFQININLIRAQFHHALPGNHETTNIEPSYWELIGGSRNGVEEQALYQEQVSEIAGLISKLPPGLARVMNYVLQGMDNKQVEQQMPNEKPASIRLKICRGRKRLKALRPYYL